MDFVKELPSDMIFQILTRNESLETLDTCKLVCKEWPHLIDEASFMPTYYKMTGNLSGFLIQGSYIYDRFKLASMFISHDQSTKTNADSLRDMSEMKILASCVQGILCIEKENRSLKRYYAYKPTTGQCVALPNPKLRYQTYAVGIMVLPSSGDYLRYGIVRLSYKGLIVGAKMQNSYLVEIFDSKYRKWLKQDDFLLPWEEFIVHEAPAISAGNSIYWLTYNKNVLSFRGSNGSIEKFSLPEEVQQNNDFHKLVEYQGKLGVTSLTREKNMELWLMEGTNWSKKYNVNLDHLREVVDKYLTPVGFYNSDIVLIKTYSEMVVLYNLQDSSYTTVKLDRLKRAAEIFKFRSDFEHVNLRGPNYLASREKGSSMLLSRIILALFLLFLFLKLLVMFWA